MKELRSIIKLALPYGFMSWWLRRCYNITIDAPLFSYPGVVKRMRRIVKFALPYGLMLAYRLRDFPIVVQQGVQDGLPPSPPPPPPPPVNVPSLRDLAWQVWKKRPGSVRDRIAVFSPMPPEESGIANFSAQLHGVEPEKWDVFAGIDSVDVYARNIAEVGEKYNVLPYAFYKNDLNGRVDYRALVYVIGNSQFHYDAVDAAVRSKGAGNRWLYLHEAELVNALFRQTSDADEDIYTFLRRWYPERNLKPFGTDVPVSIQCQRQNVFGVRALVELTGIDKLIVNNSRCRELVLSDLTAEQRKRVRVERLFHPIERQAVAEENKIRFGSEGQKVIGSFGIPSSVKGTELVAAAVARLNRDGFSCKLLLAGYQAKQYVEHVLPNDCAAHCLVPDGTDDSKTFRRIMAGVDLAVQLRLEQHGESSGCVSQLLGLGTPVLTNRGFAEPDQEEHCHCVSAEPSVDELAKAIKSALLSKERKTMPDNEIAKYSFEAASAALCNRVSPAGNARRKRRRFFVDATYFDGHGITRACDFLCLAMRNRYDDIEITYMADKDSSIVSPIPHRYILVDKARRDYELMRILREEKPEFAFFPSNGVLPREIDEVRGVTRIVMTLHDLIPLRIPEVLNISKDGLEAHSRGIEFSLAHSDTVVCDSEYTIKDLRELFPKYAAKAKCLYFAPMLTGEPADISHFGSGPFFLYNGGYCPRKGINLLVRNFMALKEAGKLKSELWMTSHPNIGVAGDVELFKRGLERGWIKELGYVSDGELISLFHSAVGMVYASLYEGFGLPPLEAMNAGCPSVVARTSSLPEVCGDAVLWLEDREDDQKFQEALVRLENDRKLRRELIRKGKAQAAKFTWDKSAKAFMDALDSVR